MKMRYNNKTTNNTTGNLAYVSSSITKNGYEIITVHMQDGRIFSAFKSVWDMQNLKIEDLNEGDKLDIEYVTSVVGTAHYENFTKLTRILSLNDVKQDEMPF